MTSLYRESAFFSGHVQGVGFRYAALQVAREYEVAGWVRNLPDGRVEMDVEGSEAEVNHFISAVEARMHGFIRKIERRKVSQTAGHKGFAIV